MYLSDGMNEMEDVYEFGPFRLETKERRLLRDGRSVRLRAKVLDTLCVLVSRSGSLIEKDDLIAAVWPDTIVEENNLAHNINALRKALGDAMLIETVPGRGYRFLGTTLLRVVSPAPRAGDIAADGPVLFERDHEMKGLQEAFAETLAGRRQFVCIPGEPGVGKTTLVHAFLQEVRRTSDARIGRGQCLENRGEVEPYIAVLEALGGFAATRTATRWLRYSIAGHRRGWLKCRGWPALRLWRNSPKGISGSLAIACCANLPNWSKSWLSLARSSCASMTCIGVTIPRSHCSNSWPAAMIPRS